MNALQFEALKVALKQDATGYVLTVKIHPDEIPEELLRDFVGARYMVAMARLNDDETATPVKNRVKQAGIICRDKQFQEYVQTFYAVEATEADATRVIYEVCEREQNSAERIRFFVSRIYEMERQRCPVLKLLLRS